MELQLLTEETFDNGVTLRLYDASRQLAGDRWLVALTARATVPVRETPSPDVTPGDFSSLRQALGDQIVFEQKRERYFIDASQKAAVLDQMLESFRSMTRNYVAHPQFPARFIAKSFREHQARLRLNDQMNSVNGQPASFCHKGCDSE
jgi:hypothetical protein